MLSWFRRRFWPTQGEQFANSVGQSLDWWLLGLDAHSRVRSKDDQLLELATQMHTEGRSIREATCMLANVLVGDIIILRSAAVRAETLSHMRVPEVFNSLMYFKSSDCVMLLDLLDNAPTANSSLLDGSVRDEMRRTIFERAAGASLSQDSQLLFAGIRHLWERAIVSVNLERDNASLREMAGRLVDESIFSLEGDGAEARTARHLTKALETALSKTDLADASDDAT